MQYEILLSDCTYIIILRISKGVKFCLFKNTFVAPYNRTRAHRSCGDSIINNCKTKILLTLCCSFAPFSKAASLNAIAFSSISNPQVVKKEWDLLKTPLGIWQTPANWTAEILFIVEDKELNDYDELVPKLHRDSLYLNVDQQLLAFKLQGFRSEGKQNTRAELIAGPSRFLLTTDQEKIYIYKAGDLIASFERKLYSGRKVEESKDFIFLIKKQDRFVREMKMSGKTHFIENHTLVLWDKQSKKSHIIFDPKVSVKLETELHYKIKDFSCAMNVQQCLVLTESPEALFQVEFQKNLIGNFSAITNRLQHIPLEYLTSLQNKFYGMKMIDKEMDHLQVVEFSDDLVKTKELNKVIGPIKDFRSIQNNLTWYTQNKDKYTSYIFDPTTNAMVNTVDWNFNVIGDDVKVNQIRFIEK